jgi:hypothetical protein
MNPLPSLTLLSDAPRIDSPSPDKLAEWAKMFAERGADPLALVGVLPDGTPVIAAVESIRGEPFELRQLLTDILLRIGDR